MKEPEARTHGYRCPDCGEPMNESRGDYYCPECLIKEATNVQMPDVGSQG